MSQLSLKTLVAAAAAASLCYSAAAAPIPPRNSLFQAPFVPSPLPLVQRAEAPQAPGSAVYTSIAAQDVGFSNKEDQKSISAVLGSPIQRRDVHAISADDESPPAGTLWKRVRIAGGAQRQPMDGDEPMDYDDPNEFKSQSDAAFLQQQVNTYDNLIAEGTSRQKALTELQLKQTSDYDVLLAKQQELKTQGKPEDPELQNQLAQSGLQITKTRDNIVRVNKQLGRWQSTRNIWDGQYKLALKSPAKPDLQPAGKSALQPAVKPALQPAVKPAIKYYPRVQEASKASSTNPLAKADPLAKAKPVLDRPGGKVSPVMDQSGRRVQVVEPVLDREGNIVPYNGPSGRLSSPRTDANRLPYAGRPLGRVSSTPDLRSSNARPVSPLRRPLDDTQLRGKPVSPLRPPLANTQLRPRPVSPLMPPLENKQPRPRPVSPLMPPLENKQPRPNSVSPLRPPLENTQLRPNSVSPLRPPLENTQLRPNSVSPLRPPLENTQLRPNSVSPLRPPLQNTQLSSKPLTPQSMSQGRLGPQDGLPFKHVAPLKASNINGPAVADRPLGGNAPAQRPNANPIQSSRPEGFPEDESESPSASHKILKGAKSLWKSMGGSTDNLGQSIGTKLGLEDGDSDMFRGPR